VRHAILGPILHGGGSLEISVPTTKRLVHQIERLLERTTASQGLVQELQWEERTMNSKTAVASPQRSHSLVEKVLAAKPPIAKLIGFEVEEIGKGCAVANRTAACQSDGHAARRSSLRPDRRRHGYGIRFDFGAGSP
jgi:hypothetical protein